MRLKKNVPTYAQEQWKYECPPHNVELEKTCYEESTRIDSDFVSSTSALWQELKIDWMDTCMNE